jgi:hypothetical protein
MTFDEWKEIRCEKWRNEEISKIAKSIWKSKDCPKGLDNEIWLEAEFKLFKSDEADAHHGPCSDW